MLINLKSVITNLVGSPFPESAVSSSPMTVKSAIVFVLVNSIPGENLSGDEKFKLYQLAVKVHSEEDSVDLSVEDVSLIKNRIGTMFLSPEVIGDLYIKMGV